MFIVFIYRYVLWIFYILGNIGHLLNIYVFTRSCFRSNPCCLYFLALTIINLLIVWVLIPLKILQYGFNIDLKLSSVIFCKLFFFIYDSAKISSSWFLTFACADRYCFTSLNIGIRQLSTTKNTRYMIPFLTIFIFFSNIPILFFYKITNQCIPLAKTYQKYLAIYRLLTNTICPILLMLIFGILILINIHKLRKRISPFMIDIINNHHIIRKKRRIDKQIYLILIFQCSSSILLNILLLFLNENFLFLSLINHSLTFYFFLLFSQLFRREIMKFIKKIIRIRHQIY